MSAKSPKKTLLNYFKIKPSPVLVSDIDNENDLNQSDYNCEANTRRPTRACASKAREAWNSSTRNGATAAYSDEDSDDFVESTRKRTRNSSRRKQTTLSSNGSIVHEKVNKKKMKLDPETEAFLRSGVPDVILKSRAKSQDNNSSSSKIVPEEKTASAVSRKTLDPETLAFLHSGVPEVVAKAKQVVDKRRDHDEALVTLGFFPKTSHTCGNDDTDTTKESPDAAQISYKSKPKTVDDAYDDSVFQPALSAFHLKYLPSESKLLPVELCCEDTPIKILSQDSQYCSQENDSRPWIDKLRVTAVRNLVVDKKALDTLARWLKQWKLDIKDDGGTSRKQEIKKKRGQSSDSDFITSDDEDSDLKKKSVLLTGPSGCAKTAAVYVLAKHLGFEVVEVNFSSRRPGKEVLQRVEEAVLSHRLKSSQNCLLLFKDIDLLHPEEDEGFCSAVAQLITTAVRPIVMTSCLPVYSMLDSKLDRKDPLRVSFSYPKPQEIVRNILKPILSSVQVYRNQVQSDDIVVEKWLDSIVRHCNCDIRQSINQLQLLLSTSTDSSNKVFYLTNDDIHRYSSPFQRHLVDLNFPRQSVSTNGNIESQGTVKEMVDEDDVNLSLSGRNKKSAMQLQTLSEELELFADFDWISRLSPSIPTRNINAYGDYEEAAMNWNYSEMRDTFFARLALKRRDQFLGLSETLRELVLESDEEVQKWVEIVNVNNDIEQYMENTSGGVDWESCSAVRTIVKRNLLDSVGRIQKRHGRVTSYFNRMDRSHVTKISNTLGFSEELKLVKDATGYE